MRPRAAQSGIAGCTTRIAAIRAIVRGVIPQTCPCFDSCRPGVTEVPQAIRNSATTPIAAIVARAAPRLQADEAGDGEAEAAAIVPTRRSERSPTTARWSALVVLTTKGNRGPHQPDDTER